MYSFANGSDLVDGPEIVDDMFKRIIILLRNIALSQSGF